MLLPGNLRNCLGPLCRSSVYSFHLLIILSFLCSLSLLYFLVSLYLFLVLQLFLLSVDVILLFFLFYCGLPVPCIFLLDSFPCLSWFFFVLLHLIFFEPVSFHFHFLPLLHDPQCVLGHSNGSVFLFFSWDGFFASSLKVSFKAFHISPEFLPCKFHCGQFLHNFIFVFLWYIVYVQFPALFHLLCIFQLYSYCSCEEFVVRPTVSFWSCLHWLKGSSPSPSAKYIVNLVFVLAIRSCPFIKPLLCLFKAGVRYEEGIFFAEIKQSFSSLISASQPIPSYSAWFFSLAHFGVTVSHEYEYIFSQCLVQCQVQISVDIFYVCCIRTGCRCVHLCTSNVYRVCLYSYIDNSVVYCIVAYKWLWHLISYNHSHTILAVGIVSPVHHCVIHTSEMSTVCPFHFTYS